MDTDPFSQANQTKIALAPQDISALSHSLTVRDLLEHSEPVSENDRCLKVLERFLSNTHLTALAIVNHANQPVGLMERGRMTEIFLKPYARDLYHRTPIRTLMNEQSVVVDINASLDELARIILSVDAGQMAPGFIVTEHGSYAGLASSELFLRKITQRKQEELFYLAHYDQLTGVANRLLFHDRLKQALAAAKRQTEIIALGFIDLDRFKQINDTLGHAAGDELLVTIAKRLDNEIRASDTVARLGGDEFVILLRHLDSAASATRLVDNILNKLRRPIEIKDTTLTPEASIGVAVFPDHALNAEELVQNADAAMYEVKQQGRNGYLMFCEQHRAGLLERINLEAELRQALSKHQLFLEYQPLIDLTTEAPLALEVFLRWRHPKLGLIPASQLTTIAEQSRLILELNEWVLRTACQQHRLWQTAQLTPPPLAVNISTMQYRQASFQGLLTSILADVQMPANLLILELTENSLAQDAATTTCNLHKLKSLGVKLAIDDYGAGVSSLGLFADLPIDQIKIDESFIRHIENNAKNQALVKTVLTLGEHLRIGVVAEGVETAEELACLKALHCPAGQGYFWHKPMPIEVVEQYLNLKLNKAPAQSLKAQPGLQ
ncbi:MAG: EAL domain-containing protein [Methylococcales bacterium]|nr:EAL domain-containing protein [Methylococcales bacterium]